jgi:hypothetical protein
MENRIYYFEGDNQIKAIGWGSTESVVVLVVSAGENVSNSIEGSVDPLADTARRIVNVYGETLHRLADS